MHFYYLIFRIILVHVFFVKFLRFFHSFCLYTCIFFKFCTDSFYFILYSWTNHIYFHFQGIHFSFMKKLYVFSSSEDCSIFDLTLEITAIISSPKTKQLYCLTNPTYDTGLACAVVWFCSWQERFLVMCKWFWVFLFASVSLLDCLDATICS